MFRPTQPFRTHLRVAQRRWAPSGAAPAATPITGADTGVGAEASALTVQVFGTDVGSGAEASALTTQILATDVGAGAEASALTAVYTGADAGTGAEASALRSLFTGTDTGSGAETAVFFALLTGTDAGAGADASALLALLAGTDVGAGTETSLAGVFFFGSDTGSGAEASLLIALYAGTDAGSGTEASVMTFWTTPSLLDNANRANEGPPPTGWSLWISSGIKVLSNQLAPFDTSDNGAYWNTAMPADVAACVTIATHPNNGGQSTVVARLDPATGGVVGTAYGVDHLPVAGTDTIQITRQIASTLTVLGSWQGELAAGDKLGIRAVGSTIEAWANYSGEWHLVGSVVDTAIPGTGTDNKVGIYNYGAAGTGARYDDFSAGSAVSSPVSGSDAGSSSDASALTALALATDTGAAAEASALLALYVVTDTGVGTETSIAGVFFFGTDGGSGAQTALLSALLAASDVGVGADLLTALARAVFDTGLGSEASALPMLFTGTDVGAGSDLGGLLLALVGSDTGAGSELSAVLRFLLGSDAGLGTNTLTQRRLTATDAAAAVDAALLSILVATGTYPGVYPDSGGGRIAITGSAPLTLALPRVVPPVTTHGLYAPFYPGTSYPSVDTDLTLALVPTRPLVVTPE